MREKVVNSQTVRGIKRGSAMLFASLSMLLATCTSRPATVPNTEVLADIQVTLDQAVVKLEAPTEALTEDEVDLLDELIPSLSLNR